MIKAQIHKPFEEKEIIPAFEDTMSRLEEVLKEEKDRFREQFVKAFSEACARYDDTYPDKPVYLMMLQLLRTDLLERKYRYRIVFYGTDWYLGRGVTAGEIDTGAVFLHYHELESRLLSETGKYGGAVSRASVRHHMNALTELFSSYTRELILYSIAQATETDAYLRLKKEAQFQIHVGELLEPGDLVYREQEVKNQELILRQLTCGEKTEFYFQDWKGLDFSGLNLAGYDLRYTDFRGCNLESSAFDFCLMPGAKMGGARLKNCRLRGCTLHDVDFTGSDLQGADLSYSISYTGKDIESEWRMTGYMGGSFRDADLRGASLFGGVFCGIDFRQSRLTGADFREAGLYRCRMKQEQIKELELTREQLQQMDLEN